VLNAGGYYCREVRHRADRLSEHALGNAIDIVGFDFGPMLAEAGENPARELPESLKAGFSVRIERHWQATAGVAARHAAFLDALASALDERDVFRTLLGPGHATHGTHFHFDMAPYAYTRL
jgi:hypothetical protein